ncbi:aminoglycoside 6-adenylyltransferase [Streptomyces sp. NPDC057702]|uniref:aminoglycoside 6-adenylyltransferase n=1 Tax=Streptomyces sp. NPDC057702 TaxID=3346221 RepID=UPI00367F00F7
MFHAGALAVDFQVVPVRQLGELAAEERDAPRRRGHRIPLDGEGPAGAPPAPSGAAREAERPDEDGFQELGAAFWHGVAHLSRCPARGGLWVAKARDGTARTLLLTVTVCPAHSRRGVRHDAWRQGAETRGGVAPGARERVAGACGGFAPDACPRAARTAADLFAELSREVTGAYGFGAPEAVAYAVRPPLDRLPAPHDRARSPATATARRGRAAGRPVRRAGGGSEAHGVAGAGGGGTRAPPARGSATGEAPDGDAEVGGPRALAEA